jgi:class 3 adenylate cyclase
VNKFIGDAVFAIFGAPLPQPDHASRALACMLEMDAFAEKFVAEQRERGVEFGLTRIGGHTGRAMIGNFGSESRFEYTALGDAVNTAARLEGLNKYFGTRLCVSGSLREQSGERAFRPMGAVVLKGKTESIEVFEPLSAERAGSSFMLRYREAFELLRHGDPRAAALFEALAREEPEDGCVALHLERIKEGRLDAVIVMTDK